MTESSEAKFLDKQVNVKDISFHWRVSWELRASWSCRYSPNKSWLNFITLLMWKKLCQCSSPCRWSDFLTWIFYEPILEEIYWLKVFLTWGSICPSSLKSSCSFVNRFWHQEVHFGLWNIYLFHRWQSSLGKIHHTSQWSIAYSFSTHWWPVLTNNYFVRIAVLSGDLMAIALNECSFKSSLLVHAILGLGA